MVTGGAGFIGSNFVLDWLAGSNEPVINLDALTYAGNRANLDAVAGDRRHSFVHGSIGDSDPGRSAAGQYATCAPWSTSPPRATSTARSAGPAPFFETNVMGTLQLLEAVRGACRGAAGGRRGGVPLPARLHRRGLRHARPTTRAFTETNPYRPNSPYAASKAASDHLVRAYRETYGLPASDHQLLEQLRAATSSPRS